MSRAPTWYRRSALLYTLGAWTVFGSVVVWCSSRKAKRDEESPPEKHPAGNKMGSATAISEDGLQEDGLPNTSTYYTLRGNFSVQSTTIYKPNFVPYSTRLYSYVQSFFDNSGGKEK